MTCLVGSRNHMVGICQIHLRLRWDHIITERVPGSAFSRIGILTLQSNPLQVQAA